MKPIEQLNLWVDNISAHNNEADECCPDFSCCRYDINTPRHIKLAFQKSYIENNEKFTMDLLMLFLGQLITPNFDIEKNFKDLQNGIPYENNQD